MCHDSNIEWPVKSTRKEKHIINIPSCENEGAIKVENLPAEESPISQ